MTTEIKASCQCGQLTVKSTVPDERLPLDLYLCSCNTCRWLSGQLAISSVNLHQSLEVHGNVTRYATSTGARGLDRCFCPKCGTFVYEDCLDPERIGLFGGAMEKADGLVKFKGIIYAASTVDGGLARWLPDHPAFVEDSKGDNVQHFVPPNAIRSSNQVDLSETLLGACLCGGYQFKTSRPNEASYDLSSEYSDSLIPRYEGKAHLNPKNEKWWIRSNGTKYAAAICACVDCRKSSGQDFVQWAFVPSVNIFGKDGSPFDPYGGTLTVYDSSEHGKRYFCKVCGANAFLLLKDRPDLIDVNVGLLRSKQGSLAEDWLEWFKQRIGFNEEGQNTELVGALQAGIERDCSSKAGSK